LKLELFHIKILSGDDILAYIDMDNKSENKNIVKLIAPLVTHYDRDEGLYTKLLNPYSESSTINLNTSMIVFMGKGNESSHQIYNNFYDKIVEEQESDDTLMELFDAMLESRDSTKH
jgi:hypothetical protein